MLFYQVKILELNITRLASKCHQHRFARLKCTKIVGGRGGAPNPAGGAYDAPPDPLVGWRGGKPPPRPHPPRRLDSRSFGARLGAYGASYSFAVKMYPPLFSTFRRPWLLIAYK